jgi:type IV pilus assembly protein PilV
MISIQNKIKKQKGFTLIEAMIAVVVFSFGLLGVAGVMTVSVKSNHNGYMRSQAIFLVSTMADMMRANVQAVKSGSYNVSGVNGYSSVVNMCGGSSSACNFAGIKDRDVQLWSNMMTIILPNAEGEISCTGDTSPTWNSPYTGLCDITIDWTESNQTDAESQETMTIVVKP